MTATSDQIEALLSYAWNDWSVTRKEMDRIAVALQSDPVIDSTISDLNASGGLDKLFMRVTLPSPLRRVVGVLASRTATAAPIARAALISAKRRNHVLSMPYAWSGFQADVFFDLCRDLGRASVAQGFSAAVSPSGGVAAAPADHGAPFTGVGATGDNPTSLSIGLIDQARLAAGHDATVSRYSNPIPGDLGAYLRGLAPAQRVAQASTLVRQPISTLFPSAYRGSPPLRSRVIWAAGRAFRLEPELIAAIILAEQRDQSRNEDAKDYVGATSLLQGNTSIGLGQVVVTTAVRHDLFKNLLPTVARRSLTHNQVATLLASDEFNIFATAQYIRIVADAAATTAITTLPNTVAEFPAISMSAYGGHSSNWPADNVKALASEYTSAPWDDRLSSGWAWFVDQGFATIKRSGLAFP